MNTRYIVSGIVQKGDELILGKKAKGRPPYPDVWHTPGGGVENAEKAKQLFGSKDFDNEYFYSELKRELKEELGVEVKNIKCIVPEYKSSPREGDAIDKNGNPIHFYFLEYLCDYSEGELKPSDDLAEAIWIKKEDLRNYSLTPPSQEMYKELGWIKM
jgi:ADP-ribose pyrophosphatase YjhB (NUDIX family)